MVILCSRRIALQDAKKEGERHLQPGVRQAFTAPLASHAAGRLTAAISNARR